MSPCSSPWWFSVLPIIAIISRIGLYVLVFGGSIYFLKKVSSIDHTLKEIEKCMNDNKNNHKGKENVC